MMSHISADRSPRPTVGSSKSTDATVEIIADRSAPDQIRFSVVVPTFNEQASIKSALDSLYGAISIEPDRFEVIVVDESTDRTPQIIRNLNYRNLRLIRFEQQRGLAGSVIEGFAASCGTYLGVIDADGQHPAKKLFELFETAVQNGCDVVIASRHVEGGGIENWSVYRKVVSVGATYIAKWILLRNQKVLDPMSGFFVVRQASIENVTLDPVGYKILLEILVRGDVGNIKEVGYQFTDRDNGESNLDFREYLNYLAHVYRLIKYQVRNKEL